MIRLILGCPDHLHVIPSGRVAGRVPILSDRLLPDLDFQLWQDPSANSDDSGPVTDPCNSFKADKTLGRKSDMFDLSGIVTLVCRYVLQIGVFSFACWLQSDSTAKGQCQHYCLLFPAWSCAVKFHHCCLVLGSKSRDIRTVL